MTIFRLILPGIEFTSPDPLDIADTGTTVQARFNDSLLWMPPGNSLSLDGRFDSASATLILTGTFTAQPVRFLNGQFELRRIELRIRVTDDPAGSGKIMDGNATTPVAATGEVDWISEMIQRIGVSSGRLPFDLGYTFQANGQSGFTLALDATPANPVSLARLAVDIQQARLGVVVFPNELAIEVSLAGDAALQVNGQYAAQIRQILETVFGAGNSPPLDPPPFIFRRKFRLEAGGLPGVALELPSFSLLPDWSGGIAPTLPPFPDLRISIGAPRFTFQLPDLANPLPDLELVLRDCTIGLDLPDIGRINLAGNLNFQRLAGGGFSFQFEPGLGGTINLPAILRFFLDQIAWLGGALPDLDQLPELLRLSQAELDWDQLFRDLQIGFDPLTFKDAFRAILDGAAITPGAPPVDRLFRLAFRVLAQVGDQAFRLMWEVWFELLPNAWDELVKLLQVCINDLSVLDFARLLDQLVSLEGAGLVLQDFLRAALEFGAGQTHVAFDQFMKLWLQIFAAISRGIAPPDFAEAVYFTCKNVSPGMNRFIRLSDLPAFQFEASLTSPQFTFRVDLLLISLGLQGIVRMAALEELVLAFSDSSRLLEYLLRPLFDFLKIIFPVPAPIDATQVLGLLAALFTNAEGDEESEFLLMQLGRIFPLGVIFALVGAAWNLLRPDHLMPWANLLFRTVEEDPSQVVIRLPAPKATGTPVKYLILSDIHRDARSDDRGLFNAGSIDHFSEHRQLYLDILNHADAQGYTVIEDGDGEELWFIRDFSSYNGPADQLDEILTTHADIYAKLADMYRRGKYLRMIGNHDSYLRNPAVFNVMESRFPDPDPNGRAFTLYDFIIIDGVKTMDEHSLFNVLTDIWDGLGAEDKFEAIVNNIALGRFGLDSEPYQEKKPLIITHGHQWDFWNCDNNNLVGKLFANSVGVPADMLNDPLNDLAGLALAGSPMVDFQDILARQPVFENFPAYQSALSFAHQVQHMPDKQRLLVDGVMYLETLPAIMSMFTMPLNLRNNSGAVTQRWVDVLDSTATLRNFFEHLFNQICLGHTHNPQAHPYFDIEKMIAGPLDPIVKGVREKISETFGLDVSLNIFKSRYFNSGTSGWTSGVVWGIEINEFGEARLVFWTKDGRIDRPQSMDWQLPRQDDAWRAALAAKRQDFIDYWKQLPELFGNSAMEIIKAVAGLASLPLDALVAFADEIAVQAFEINLETISSLGSAQPGAPDPGKHFQLQMDQIAQWLVVALISLMRRQAAPPGSLPSQVLTLTVPIPTDMEASLDQITTLLKAVSFPGVTQAQLDQRLTEAACIWLLANQSAGALNRSGRLHIDVGENPVVFMAFALIALLPGAGATGLPFSSQAAIANHQLKITLTVN